MNIIIIITIIIIIIIIIIKTARDSSIRWPSMRKWLRSKHGFGNIQTDPVADLKMTSLLGQHLDLSAKKVREWIVKYHQEGIEESEFDDTYIHTAIGWELILR